MDYCSLVKEEGLSAINSYDPGDCLDNVPDERTGTGKDMASVLENQCLTIGELNEAYDAEGWFK